MFVGGSLLKAVILLSGGLDSATVLAMAAEQSYQCYALSFNYGQRHRVELHAAKQLASAAAAGDMQPCGFGRSGINTHGPA